MFPDSKIAEELELGPNELKFLVNHRLAPYFKECLSDDILKSEYFVVSFDESLNTTVMDLLVRHSDSMKNRLLVWYWDSMFFDHGTHADLLKYFDEGSSGLKMSKHVIFQEERVVRNVQICFGANYSARHFE